MLGLLLLAFAVMLCVKLFALVAISWLLVFLPLIVLSVYGLIALVVIVLAIIAMAVMGD